MKTILIMKGLPGSGKSTYARELIDKNPWQWKRFNKDELRMMLDNGRWSKFNESMVLVVRDMWVEKALQDGCNVIIDDTNFEVRHEERMKEIAKKYKAKVEIKFIDTPIQECIDRDAKRPNPVWAEVIRKMYRQYIQKEEKFVTIPYNNSLQDAIIVDIDGTLAIKWDRSIYDLSLIHLDTINPAIKEIANWFFGSTIIMSGRDESCRRTTKKWLKDNNIIYDKLLMRPEWDTRNDTIIKKELYEANIKGKYNVVFTLDDRVRLVNMWREMWIYTLDCNQTREVF